MAAGEAIKKATAQTLCAASRAIFDNRECRFNSHLFLKYIELMNLASMRSTSRSTLRAVSVVVLIFSVMVYVMNAGAYITNVQPNKTGESDMPAPIVAPTPAPDFVDWTKAMEKPKTRKGTWDLSLAAGAGVAIKERQQTPLHAALIAEYWTTPGFALGLFARGDQAKTIDVVNFASTGYREDREYAITAYSLGLQCHSALTERVSFFFGIGRSMTETELLAVKTTAPVPSSLRTGFKGDTSANTAYHAGLGYDTKLGPLGFGAELGYSSTSDREEISIQQVFASLVIRL
jgi:hypothetical protein